VSSRWPLPLVVAVSSWSSSSVAVACLAPGVCWTTWPTVAATRARGSLPLPGGPRRSPGTGGAGCPRLPTRGA